MKSSPVRIPSKNKKQEKSTPFLGKNSESQQQEPEPRRAAPFYIGLASGVLAAAVLVFTFALIGVPWWNGVVGGTAIGAFIWWVEWTEN